MKRAILIVVLAVAGALAVPTAAQAATCSSSGYNLHASANVAAPGATVHVTTCLDAAPGAPATVGFSGGTPTNVVPAATSSTTVGPTGLVSFDVHIPGNAQNGQVYTVSAAAGSSSFSDTIRVVVVAASGLPSTGVDAVPWMLGGLALLLAGITTTIVALARRRRRAPVAS